MVQQANRISATLSDADRDEVLAALKTVKAKLPFLIDLTMEERRSVAKMGDKSRAFVEKSAEAGGKNPDLLPAKFNMSEYTQDVKLFEQLEQIAVPFTQVHEMFNDTLMALSSDLYSEALIVYTYLKAAGKGEGLDELRADLAHRFRRASKPKAP